jgi:hypothetical protein
VKTSDDRHSSEQSAPEKRLEFEKFLADLSGRLVALPPERVDDEIQNALKEVLEFFQIERCALLHLLPGKTLYRVEYNANANGISSPYVGITLPVSLFPWMTRKVAFEREVVSFARLEVRWTPLSRQIIRLFMLHFGVLNSVSFVKEISQKSFVRVKPLFENRSLPEFDNSKIDAVSPRCKE